MQVRRADHQGNFTIIDNTVLKDPSLSARAKGVFVYLLSLPDDWVLNINELYKHFKEGRNAIRFVFNELIDAGYIKMVSQRGEGGHFGSPQYSLYEIPYTENGDTVPHTEHGDTDKKLFNQKNEDSPRTEKPYTGFPQLLSTNIQSTNNLQSTKDIYISPRTENGDTVDFNILFNEIWNHYPRKSNKQKSQEAFIALLKKTPKNKRESLFKTMLHALSKQTRSKQWQNNQYVPYMSTWIHGARWKDDVQESENKSVEREFNDLPGVTKL